MTDSKAILTADSKLVKNNMDRQPSLLGFLLLICMMVVGCACQATSAPSEELCDCDCDYMDKIEYFNNASNSYVNKTKEELVQMLEKELKEVKAALEVKKAEIPVVKSRKISATDARPSAKNVGMIGVAFMVMVFGGIVVLDLLSLPQFIRSLKERLC